MLSHQFFDFALKYNLLKVCFFVIFPLFSLLERIILLTYQ